MKKIFTIFFLCFFNTGLFAQTITVSGKCIASPITLTYYGILNGRVAYVGTGTVAGLANIQVSIQWLSQFNLWVLQFSGAPYFSNPCNTQTPPGTTYSSCAWTPVDGQTCDGGSPLSITGSATLPVGLNNFNAILENGSVHLNWKTSSETNNKGFEVERSSDGRNWSNIGFIPGHLTSGLENEYSFSDRQPLIGINLYHLKQIDIDGNFTYSGIVKINFSDLRKYSLLGNNGNGIVQLNMPANKEKLVLEILDLSGKILYSKTTTNGNQTLDISRFPSGMYLLHINNATQSTIEKLIRF
ncbi:MAG: T9SS type A sorting domain-containing protein [Ginsengibacter sp.]